MNVHYLLGTYKYEDNTLTSSKDKRIKLKIAPFKSQNLAAPRYQLICMVTGHKKYNKKLSGLFKVSPTSYRGDVYFGGKKEQFFLIIDSKESIRIIRKNR